MACELHADPGPTTDLIGCSGDVVASHLPAHVFAKIYKNQHINFAVLLKGLIELSNMHHYGVVIQLNECGNANIKKNELMRLLFS